MENKSILQNIFEKNFLEKLSAAFGQIISSLDCIDTFNLCLWIGLAW